MIVGLLCGSVGEEYRFCFAGINLNGTFEADEGRQPSQHFCSQVAYAVALDTQDPRGEEFGIFRLQTSISDFNLPHKNSD